MFNLWHILIICTREAGKEAHCLRQYILYVYVYVYSLPWDEDIVHGIRSENGSANHRPSIDGKEWANLVESINRCGVFLLSRKFFQKKTLFTYVKPRYVLGDKSEQHEQRYRPKKVIGVKNMVFCFFCIYYASIDPVINMWRICTKWGISLKSDIFTSLRHSIDITLSFKILQTVCQCDIYN